MENFDKKKASFLNDLNTQEKLLYGALLVVLIFGFIYFIVPSFSDEKISLAGKCSIKDLNPVSSTKPFILAGWAFDNNTKKTYEENVKIRLISLDRAQTYVMKSDPVDRPDVANAWGLDSSAIKSGYGAVFNNVIPGMYEVIIEQVANDGSKVLCEPGILKVNE